MRYDKIRTRTAFARRLRHDMTTGQSKFAFFLGAGCSITSGIPAATELVRDHWLPRLVELETGKKTGITAWAQKYIKGYDPAAPGASYSDVIEELFDTPQKRQAEIERITTAGRPNYGYCALARLLSDEKYGPLCNVVLTTNFDDLVADALYLYGREGARPLVIGHKSLMNFVSVTRTAPMVVKLHHDRHLAPKNTKDEIGALSPEAKTALHDVLRERGLIFMGYGGADPSVISALEALPDDSLHGGVIWVNDAWPNGSLGTWLAARKAVWVKHRDFDEIMFVIARAFDVAPPPKVDDIQALFKRNEDKYKELLKNLSGDPEQEEEVRQAAQEAASKVSDAFAMLVTAYRLEKADPDAADKAYLEGIRQHPTDADLLGEYGRFLTDIRKEHEGAERFYKRAIAADPKRADFLGNYAWFLNSIRKDHEGAEAFYQRATDADPKHANILGNYAWFLKNVRKDHDGAEAFYQRAIDADPKHAHALGNYALFLHSIRKDYDGAEVYYKRAVDADPKDANTLGNYAVFLETIRKDHDGAEAFYKRAIDADPKHADILGNYAWFLENVRKDPDGTEEYYKRAINADPKHANNLSGYAVFLHTIRKDHDGAEAYYKRAIDADPKRVDFLGNYAWFLENVRKDYDGAEAYYKRAIDADPKHADILGNYAWFLRTIRKDPDGAEAYYKRAIDADPKHANTLGNYAVFLSNIRKDPDGAEAYYKRAIAADPKHANTLGNYAGFLFGLGRDGEGLGMLERCEAENPGPALLLECRFYRLCRAATTDAERAELLRLTKQAIIDGVRSPGFDLSANVERARIDNVPGVDMLAVLAKVIADEEPAETLNQFPEWVAAG